jgi:hypothetical protein
MIMARRKLTIWAQELVYLAQLVLGVQNDDMKDAFFSTC